MARVLQVEKSIVCRHGVDGRSDEGRRRAPFFWPLISLELLMAVKELICWSVNYVYFLIFGFH
jgi:hypothetical protein